MVKIALVLLALAFAPTAAVAQVTDKDPMAVVDAMAVDLMKAHGIPGIGIVGVRDGEVVHVRGFGTRDGTHPFTPATRFYIASNTKGFTGLAMARLVEEGRIDLDDPVSGYIPARFFANGVDPAKVTIRDLLAHTTGLADDPLVSRTAYSGELPPDLRTLLRFAEYRDESPARDFHYSNLGYLLSGMVIEQVTGMPWQAYVAKAVLQPAWLAATAARVPEAGEDVALPFEAGATRPLAFRKTGATLHAAGGLYSTLEDMGRWLTLFTDPNQSRLPPAHIARANQTLVDGIDQGMGPFRIEGYGYGWARGTLWDTPTTFHFGRFPGHDSMVAFSPADHLGVFVFVNERKGGIRVAGALTAMFFAAVRGAPDLATRQAGLEKMVASAYAGGDETTRVPLTRAQAPGLCGTYASDRYGTLTVAVDGDGYQVRLGDLASPAYAGEQAGQFVVAWIPGTTERFDVRETSLAYEDYGLFSQRSSCAAEPEATGD